MRPYISLLLCCILPACTVGPNYQVPNNLMPAHYAAKTPNHPLPKTEQLWWNSFSDPILVHLINQALSGSNYDIQKAYATIRQARAELNIVQADYYPQLNAKGQYERNKISENAEIISAFPPGLIPLTYSDYQFAFDASWELDVFGGIRRGVQSSSAQYQSAIENQNNVTLITAAEVAKTYTQYRVYQKRIAIAKHTIASYTETVRLVTLQKKAGTITDVDLHRSESEVLAAKAALPPLEAEAQASLAALAVLIGELPESLFLQLNKKAPIPAINAKNLDLGLPSDLLLRRPDIKIAERNLAAATADIGVATANLFPRFQLIGNFGADTTNPGNFFQSASRLWSIAPQISIPIFQGGRLKNAVKDKVAQSDGALASYKQTILQALADVESSMIRYEKERVRKESLLASFNTLYAAKKLVQLQYKAGQVSLTDVLDVERQLDQLSDQYTQSQGLMTINLISVYKALGGGWVKL
ncbi:MAG: efflux transporter outer membrane subunit [Legionellales bacterium]